MLASKTRSSLNPNVSPTNGSSQYVKTYRNFSIIHKGSLSWNQTQNIIIAYHVSHSFSTSITNLITDRSRYQIAISVVPNVPIMSLTLLTNPFLSAFFATIFVIDQLSHSAAASLSRTISLTLQFLLMVFHFYRYWSVTRTSFLHLLQNSLEICCTLLQCLWQ